MNYLRKILSVMLLAICSPTLQADTVVFMAQMDNTIYEDDQGRFSNGAGQYLFVGRTGADNGLDMLARRALLKFNLDSIPPGSAVESVALSITIDRVPIDAVGGTMTVHRLLGDWGEAGSNAPGAEGRGTNAQTGDATWLHRFFSNQNWTTPGGDFTSTASVSALYANGSETITFQSTPGMLSDVQDWVDGNAANNGWILIGDESAGMTARRMYSRENSNAGTPSLEVTFTPAEPGPESVAVAVPALGVHGYLLLPLLILLAVAGQHARLREPR